MIIREIEKTHAIRKNKEINPLRKSALGLGVFLKGLSDSVQNAKKRKEDSADTINKTPHSGASRSFKLSNARDESELSQSLPFKLNFNDEQTFVLNLLKEMRNLAADASQKILSQNERDASAERFQTIFEELNEKYPKTFASLREEEKESGKTEKTEKADRTKETTETKEARFSVSTHQEAAGTFLNIEDMIVKIFEIGAQQQGGQAANKSAKPQLNENETALNASSHIKELFMTEGSAKTFGRFNEIDRSNVLGMLK